VELLSDIKTWQTNRADRPKEEGPNKNKQNTKLGSLMNVMRFFPHFFFFSFVKETKPSALHHVKKQKQKTKKKKTNTELDFETASENLFESNKNDLHIKLASHQVPVSFQTRTSPLLSFFFLHCILYTHERAFFH
jgi:hypothetical protein